MGGLIIGITGAGGFLGQGAVLEARRRGHEVRALLRSESRAPAAWAGDAGITVVAADLSDPGHAARQAIAEADCLLHLAARMAGNDAQMREGTLAPTRALLALPPRRLVLASSMAVYDAGTLSPHGRIDESSGTEQAADLRDAYCRAKLAQEAAVLQSGVSAWILRIGILYGAGRLWNPHLGQRIGRLVVGPGKGELPLCHVRTAAAALIGAAERPSRGTEIVNVVDDPLPDRKAYVAALKARGDVACHLPLEWRIPHFFAGLLHDRGPGLLRRPVIAARLKPLSYPNTHMQARLGPIPAVDWRTVMEEPA